MDIISESFTSLPARYPELADKVAIITGSSRGIGRGIALRLAREGMKVVINSRTPEAVQATTEMLKSLGATAIGVAADLSGTAGVRELFSRTLDAFGTVDLLVNNAANLKRRHFFEVDEALLDNELATNIRGPYLCAYYAAQEMRDAGHGGSIVNISSVMTRAMALELAQYDIRVNAVAPGATLTERWPDPSSPRMQEVAARIPLGRFGRGIEIGAAVAFLASSDAAYITGQVLYVDGGITAQLSPPGQPI